MTIDTLAAQSSMPRNQHEPFRPFEHEGMAEFFREARQGIPVFYSPEINYWVLTRREDIVAVFRDPKRFSAGNATEPLFTWPPKVINILKERQVAIEATQVNSDGVRHAIIKSASSKFLNIKRFTQYEPAIRALAKNYIDQMKGKDTVDLVDAILYEFPAQILFMMYGVTDFDPRKIKSWGDLRTKMIWGDLSDAELEKAVTDLADFWDFACDLVERRKQKRGDDYPSMLLDLLDQGDHDLTENMVRNMLFALLLAGHETTTNAAGNLFLELLRHPDQWRKLVENPELARNAVEEGLRYASSVVAWRRIANEDVEIGGTHIPKGGKILLSLVSANRDEAQFDQSEIFDIERENARDHVAFGNGIHHCAGAPLARIELRILIEEMAAAFPNMRLLDGQNPEIIRTLSFRGPVTLMVRLNG